MVKLTCEICKEEYLGHDDSAAGVPHICCTCDAEKCDTSDITLENIPAHMEEHHAMGRGPEGDDE